ncbi:MAG: hypothetical protein GEU75_15195 [Dehalococcoidia bacterium]|nr:hypothetical protein [Dehalococcoidia bacterium]
MLACANQKGEPEVAGTPVVADIRQVDFYPLAETAKPPQPFSSPQDRVPQLLVYDSVTDDIVVAGDSKGSSWLSETTLAVGKQGRLAIYDAVARTWRSSNLDVPEVLRTSASPDARYLVIQEPDQSLEIVDLRSDRLAVVPVSPRDVWWNPDSTRLLMNSNVPAPRGNSPDYRVDVLAIGASFALFEVDSGPGEPIAWQWLGPDRVVAWHTESNDRMRILDVGSGLARQVFAAPMADANKYAVFAFNKDGSRVAIQAGNNVTVYESDPFQALREIPNAKISESQFVHQGIWSLDSRAIVLLENSCQPDERVTIVEIDSGARRPVAQAHAYRQGFSPDGKWIYFTHGHSLSIVPADASAQPRLLYDDVTAASQISWSSDGRFIAFPRFFGGYDRCI